MRRGVLALLLLVPLPALALSYGDITAMLDAEPPKPPSEIALAVKNSTDPWLPHDVYALVDRKAPKEVIAAVAAKASVFYDGSMKSLDEIRAEGRTGLPPETITIRKADDLVMLFEFFVDRKYERDAAVQALPAVAEQGDNEPEAAYDKRVRTHDEEVARATSKIDGHIDVTTFDIELPATLEPWDASINCFPKAKFEVNLDHVQFFSWREGMGGNFLVHAIKMDKPSKTVQLLEFNANGIRRFQGNSYKICTASPEVGKEIEAHGIKVVMKIKRTYKGQDWSGTAEFVDATTNLPVPVKK
jgi:hypothetical protein